MPGHILGHMPSFLCDSQFSGNSRSPVLRGWGAGLALFVLSPASRLREWGPEAHGLPRLDHSLALLLENEMEQKKPFPIAGLKLCKCGCGQWPHSSLALESRESWSTETREEALICPRLKSGTS